MNFVHNQQLSLTIIRIPMNTSNVYDMNDSALCVYVYFVCANVKKNDESNILNLKRLHAQITNESSQPHSINDHTTNETTNKKSLLSVAKHEKCIHDLMHFNLFTMNVIETEGGK